MTTAQLCDKVATAPVAQLAELRPFKSDVVRSSRTGGTTYLSRADLPANMQAKIQLELCPRPELPGFCWGWTGAVTSRGYGSVGYQGRVWSSHRLAYTLLVGEVSADLQVDHRCLNIRCCHPAHLEPVTPVVNGRRARADQFYCAQGHPIAGRNLIIKVKRGNECHTCRLCQLEWQRQRYQKLHPEHRFRSVERKRAEILADARRALAEQLAAAS